MHAIQHAGQSLSLRGLGRVFICGAAISSRRLHAGLRNPIKMTDYILSLQDLSLRKIYNCIQIMWNRWGGGAEIWRAMNPVWYVFCSNLWGAARTCNSPAVLQLNKRVTLLWFILPRTVCHVMSCIRGLLFCFLVLCQPETLCDGTQQADSGSLAPVSQERACFTLDLLSLSTSNIAGQTIKGSRPARRNPVPRHKKGCAPWSFPLIARNSISLS